MMVTGEPCVKALSGLCQEGAGEEWQSIRHAGYSKGSAETCAGRQRDTESAGPKPGGGCDGHMT